MLQVIIRFDSLPPKGLSLDQAVTLRRALLAFAETTFPYVGLSEVITRRYVPPIFDWLVTIRR